MIIELEKKEFGRCRHLVNQQGHIEVLAIVEGVNAGRIFVDDRYFPASGLIWLGNNDGFFFIGEANNEAFNQELNDFIDRVIISEAKKEDLDWFEGMGNHEEWDKTIENIFEHRGLGSWKQRVYTLQADNYERNSEPLLQEGYEIVKISKSLFEDHSISIDTEFLRAKIREFWSTPEQFLNEGIGYCAIYNKEVVSVCFSGFVVNDVHCIDIETLESHQGKKLAQHIAQSFVQECLDTNGVPYWDCMEMNKPSIAVAERLGFKNIFSYTGYEFSIQ
ncbi:GNAT family N-acetyltransferase [Paenibacillus paeoniae]|uniref:GNAT family N-acetyltransferase n=1 Tax=Paenibacillus paeoniae TaxID=2292705 RepID=A0A371PNC1_9BACL|nr:GNAT family N-acetyltransferase [Paenibacillus paeoniae]REK77681.1 GNAT family N-acetyltransferase [Paenibacillus paeoniae]